MFLPRQPRHHHRQLLRKVYLCNNMDPVITRDLQFQNINSVAHILGTLELYRSKFSQRFNIHRFTKHQPNYGTNPLPITVAHPKAQDNKLRKNILSHFRKQFIAHHHQLQLGHHLEETSIAWVCGFRKSRQPHDQKMREMVDQCPACYLVQLVLSDCSVRK